MRFVAEIRPVQEQHCALLPMVIQNGKIHLNLYLVDEMTRRRIAKVIEDHNVPVQHGESLDLLLVPIAMIKDSIHINLAQVFGTIIKYRNPQQIRKDSILNEEGIRHYPEKLDFLKIAESAQKFASYLDDHREALFNILLEYETFEVAEDELARSLDVLNSLDENKEFFQRKIGPVAALLPRNQPLYALTCYGVIPSYMASRSDVRAPQAMSDFFFRMVETMQIEKFCPNLFVSHEDRDVFLRRISARYTNKETGQKYPDTDAVIFTGTMENANMMRNRFDKRTLFIANGAGHNPIVVTESADVDAAVHSTLRVQFYNQGQDCANPNTLLVHSSLKDAYVEKLMRGICKMKIGSYRDRSNRIGHITDSKELERIQKFLIANQKWIHPDTPGVIEVGRNIVQPTIIIKPLKEGGNYTEQFAPIMYVQEYEDDAQLSSYFGTSDYHANAMYVTVFGKSEYIDSLLNQRQKDGTPIHDHNTIIYNNDLHAPGIERGTQPYGGYGRGASCYGINGRIVCGPTLPQREIYTQLVEPALLYEANNIKIPVLV